MRPLGINVGSLIGGGCLGFVKPSGLRLLMGRGGCSALPQGGKGRGG